MSKHATYLSLISAVLMTACTTTQVPTPSQQSSNYYNGPAPITYTQNQGPTHSQTRSYSQAPRYEVLPAGYSAGQSSVSCPAGTTPQNNGTCLMEETSVVQQVSSFNAAQAAINKQYVTGSGAATLGTTYTGTADVVSANTLMTAPNNVIAQTIRTDVTRQHGASLYRVKPGDTVYSLARRHCVSVDQIHGSNGLDSNYSIQIGQTLQLPSSHC